MKKLWSFLKSTQWLSRILFVLWIYSAFFSPFARSQSFANNYVFGVAIYSILFLGTALGIEICKNPVIKQSQKRDLNKRENKPMPEEKYVSKSSLVAIICFITFVVCIILNIEVKSVGKFFAYASVISGILSLIFFVISMTAPKTKTEAAEHKTAKFALKEERRKQTAHEQKIKAYKGVYASEQHGNTTPTENVACKQKDFSKTTEKMHTPIYMDDDLFFNAVDLVLVYEQASAAILQRHLEIGYTRAARLIDKMEELGIVGPFEGSHFRKLLISQSDWVKMKKAIISDYGFNDIEESEILNHIFMKQAQIEGIESGRALPILTVEYPLLSGEIAFYRCYATLTAKVNNVQSQYTGQLMMTNYRVVFISSEKTLSLSIDRLKLFQVHESGLEFQEDEDKIFVSMADPMLAYRALNGMMCKTIPFEGMVHINYNDIDGMEGHQFEYFCAELLRKNGFVNVMVTPGSGDQGVDILAEKDCIKYAIQCKNYAAPLSNTPVQEVHTGKDYYGCHVGIVMTNSTFTRSARELAEATGVILWDGDEIQRLIENSDC